MEMTGEKKCLRNHRTADRNMEEDKRVFTIQFATFVGQVLKLIVHFVHSA